MARSLGAQTSFYVVQLCRAVDTRNPAGPMGGPALAAGASRTFVLTSTCGVPAAATSVAGNGMVVSPASAGSLAILPAGMPPTGSTSIALAAGLTRGNNGMLLLGSGGAVTVSVAMATGSADFLLDIDGYFRASSGTTGAWENVTPAGIDLVNTLNCGNYGAETVAADPKRPTNLYAKFSCQGIYKSTDSGRTWTGPIDSVSMRGAGGVAIASQGAGLPPILYVANIRSPDVGFWRSLDGGASWTQYNVDPGGARQDYYAPIVDPYDPRHLLMAAHEQNALVQSLDGGQTWAAVSLAPGMDPTGLGGGTAFPYFIDTGNSTTTRQTWLWISQMGGPGGTWRTANGGSTWTLVDKLQHAHGASQIYQQNASGSLFVAGIYSDLGWGVLHSSDFGQTWTHIGGSGPETVVFATPKNVYAGWGAPLGPGVQIGPGLELAAQPGFAGWTASVAPTAMYQGPARAAVSFDGTNHVIVTANYNAGLWRYVEP